MATYTIAQAARRIGLTAHTLRFYDREGILPFVDRDPTGNRAFKDSDFDWLNVINCLKKTGMPIKKIKNYIDWCMEGDETLAIRLEVMRQHKEEVQERIAEYQRYLEAIDHKIAYYQAAVDAGTEPAHPRGDCGITLTAEEHPAELDRPEPIMVAQKK